MSGVKNKSPIKFESASGQHIAADFNCWFLRLCSQPQNSLAITCDPICPPIDLINTLSKWLKKLTPMFNLPLQFSMTLKSRDHFCMPSRHDLYIFCRFIAY